MSKKNIHVVPLYFGAKILLALTACSSGPDKKEEQLINDTVEHISAGTYLKNNRHSENVMVEELTDVPAEPFVWRQRTPFVE
jgi:hypothetical protein